MKPTKQKHGKENTIGKIIYGFLLFIPLFAIGITCAYAIFNKNAYLSNGNDYIDKTITLNSSNTNDIYVQGQLITFTFEEHSAQWNGIFGFSEISIDLNEIFNTELTYNRFYLYATNTNIIFYDTNGGTHQITASNRTFDSFTYKVDLSVSADKGIYDYGLAQVFTYKERALTDVFYYSIDKVEQSPLFNWANNTATYSVLENTCTTLGITTTFVPMLLSYWLMISLMYLLYDIALLIIHMAHNRIHDIESSI